MDLASEGLVISEHVGALPGGHLTNQTRNLLLPEGWDQVPLYVGVNLFQCIGGMGRFQLVEYSYPLIMAQVFDNRPYQRDVSQPAFLSTP